MSQDAHNGSGTLPELTDGGLHAFLLGHVPTLPKDCFILDVGCGTGAWLAKLYELGYRKLYGIDQNQARFGAKNAVCIAANLDWDTIQLGNTKFDLITAIEVVEHLENPGQLFRLVERNLSASGVFLLTTPNIHSAYARLRFLATGRLMQFDDKGDQTHLFPVVAYTLGRLLRTHGLEVVQVASYPERGVKSCKSSSKLISTIWGLFLADPYPGSNLCLWIRHAAK